MPFLVSGGGGVKFFDSVLSAAAASFDITNIPAGFAVATLFLSGRGTDVGADVACDLRFNGDNGANYEVQNLAADTASVSASQSLGASSINLGEIAAGGAPAGNSGSLSASIVDYAGTTFRKTVRSFSGEDYGAGPNPFEKLVFGAWLSAAAINRITVFPSAANFAAGTRCVLVLN